MLFSCYRIAKWLKTFNLSDLQKNNAQWISLLVILEIKIPINYFELVQLVMEIYEIFFLKVQLIMEIYEIFFL